jgi:putative Ca2+/H+ antiporter (TMEM165/GDT1 family)
VCQRRLVDLGVVLACFPLVALAELPDKTMFASLVLATRGRPGAVWLGAAGAFTVHVALATTVGVVLFHLAPHRLVEALAAAVLVVAAAWAWRHRGREEADLAEREAGRHSEITTAFVVVFVAEWGDLTQLLTVDLAARYHQPLAVGVGALGALWLVAAVAVSAGRWLARAVPTAVVDRVTAAALLVMAGLTAWAAVR